MSLSNSGVFHTLEDPDGGRVIVDAASGPEGSGENGGGGDQVVGESVVQVALVV